MVAQDLFLGPLFFLVILFFGVRYKNSLKDKESGRFFLQGLILKCIGAVGVYLIYFGYYKSGDTTYYFKRATFITDKLFSDPVIGLKLLLTNPSVYDFETYSLFRMLSAFDTSSYIIAKFCAITNIICFDSYVANALIFAAVSYYGIWKMYLLFSKIFPDSKQIIAYSFLFIPSVFFWGSGVFKDCVTIGLIGMLISAFYQLLIKPKSIVLNLFVFLLSIYLIGVIKSYVLLALIPSLSVWTFFAYRNKIKSGFLKAASTPVFILLIVVLGGLSLQLMSSSFSKFNLENMATKAEDMQRWHSYTVEVLNDGSGSSYNLGEVSFTATGIFKKIPAGINVSLFRPYLWEVRSPIVLLSWLESTVLLLLSLRLFWLAIRRPGATISFINNNSSILFMLIFSLIFAFSVGFTSYNFGALSRYRIPLLPFYVASIMLMTQHLKSLGKLKK